LKRIYLGIITTVFGSIIVEIIIVKITFLPLNSNLEKPYATIQAEQTVSRIVGITILQEFSKKVEKGTAAVERQPFTYPSNVKCSGRSLMEVNISAFPLKDAINSHKMG
jgi:hypothetical protein